jgi:hypothetical protein
MYEEPADRILDFLKDLFASGPFKAFYDDDPDDIPLVNLPALVVEMQSNNIDTANSPTGTDYVTEEIIVKVIYDKRADYKRQPNQVSTRRKIRKIVEERDSTGAYSLQSIKGALRKNLSLGEAVLDNDMRFEIGVLPRPDGVITAEGHLTISVSYFVGVTGRS